EFRFGCSKPGGDRLTRLGPEERIWQRRSQSEARLWSPFLHRHCCSPAGLGSDLKLIHQTPYPRQPQPEASRGGEAVSQRLTNIRDPGTVIGSDDRNALTVQSIHYL